MLRCSYTVLFEVLEQVTPLAYRLKFPEKNSYDMISITQLMPAPVGDDPFNRVVPEPGPVIDHELGDNQFEVDKLVKRRVKNEGDAPRWNTS